MGDLQRAIELYRSASEYAHSAFSAELSWQRHANFNQFSESDLLRESAWVILCSGFREQTVRRVFDHVSLSFCDWESAASIVDAGECCVRSAFAVFRNSRKLRAILAVSELISSAGFDAVKTQILARPIPALMSFPHIGSVTAWHLAKNLGLNVAKPDRHLSRLTAKLNFCCADHLCDALAREVGEPPKVIDLILWRYLADNVQARSLMLT